MKKNLFVFLLVFLLPVMMYASFSAGATMCIDSNISESLEFGTLSDRQNYTLSSMHFGVDLNFKAFISDTQLTIYGIKTKSGSFGVSSFLTQGLFFDIDVFSLSAGVSYPFEFNLFRDRGFSFRSPLSPEEGWNKVPLFAHIKMQVSFKEIHLTLASHAFVPTNFTLSGKWDNNYTIKNALHSINIGLIASYLF